MKTIYYIRLSLVLLLGCLVNIQPAGAQQRKQKKQKEPYTFTIEVEYPRTPTKNQGSSSTCWSFSGTSFLESELIRQGKEPVELSVMFTVRNTYIEKADRFLRWHGNVEMGPGGAFHDVINQIRKYGIVPLEIYQGNEIGESSVKHGEMDGVLKGYMEGVIKSSKPSTAWKDGFASLTDAYLGKVTETFSYKGKTYTPESYAASLGLNLDDYIEISSFTHHPFYQTFVLEVPDNWSRDLVYNVPLDDMMEIINYSLRDGYTVAWASDLEQGFNFALGVAVVPPDNRDRTFKPGMEPAITQERRQLEFDNYMTTDDHGMHLTGIARDQKGNIYYLEKNSWGEGNKFKGYSYISENYVRLKTTCIMVNKHAVPSGIRDKLGL